MDRNNVQVPSVRENSQCTVRGMHGAVSRIAPRWPQSNPAPPILPPRVWGKTGLHPSQVQSTRPDPWAYVPRIVNDRHQRRKRHRPSGMPALEDDGDACMPLELPQKYTQLTDEEKLQYHNIEGELTLLLAEQPNELFMAEYTTPEIPTYTHPSTHANPPKENIWAKHGF